MDPIQAEANAENAARTALFYDKFWKGYGAEPEFDERVRMVAIERALSEFIREGHRTILDLGCGRGWMAPYLTKWGSVTGIDFSPTGLAFARSRYAGSGRFLLADANLPRLGLPHDASFDVVICSEVIEHVVEPVHLLGQISELLMPDGWCIVTTPNGRFWPQFGQDPRFRDSLQPVENWLTPRRCARLFAAAGFAVLRHHGFPDPGYQPVANRALRHPLLGRALRRLRLGPLERSRSLAVDLYQLIVARKRPGRTPSATVTPSPGEPCVFP